MKILHVVSSMRKDKGGVADCIENLSTFLTKHGVSSETVCLDNSADFQPCTHIHAISNGITHFQYSRKLRVWLESNIKRFDAVVIHGIWQYHAYCVRSVARQSNTPYFVYTHGMLDPWFKKTYPLKHLKKWLFWPWADYRVLRDARAVLFTCEEERLLASQSFWLYKATEVVVKFGAATPPQDSQKLCKAFLLAFPELRDKRLFLFLSRIHEKKGCDLLIEAFARVAHQDATMQLVMAGPDQSGWMQELKALAEHFGIGDRITWTGMIQGDQKWGAFYASELFVLPSHQENFGIAVAESLGCGLPVLISNKVNIWREIEADGAGLVGADTVQDTEQNLRRWLNFDANQRLAMGRQAVQTFNARFTVEEMAKSLAETIKRFIQ